MKNVILIFFLFSCYNVVAQQRFPVGPPTQFSTGYFKQGYHQSDSGTIIANRDTNWLAKYSATIVFKPSNKQFYWFDSATLKWNQFGSTIDTTSLSNRINLKLNISDTANMLLPYLRKADTTNKWVQDIYVRNDSLFKFKNGSETFIDTLGNSGGGGSGTVTSVALSMPSAFSVTGSPITTSGTFSVSGAGSALQYIRGNGTLATTDTGMIPDFYLKVRGLLSGTSPITFNTTTGAIGINNANTSGTKGAATFNSSDFSDNGTGTISLSTLVASGSCTGCVLNIDSKGRITGYSDGAGGATNNTNIGSGFRPVNEITQEMRTYFAGFGQRIDSVANTDGLTWSADTTRGTGVPTYFYVDSLPSENISNTALTANGNYAQDWDGKMFYVDSIGGSLLFRTGGYGSGGTLRKGLRINWGGSSSGNNLDGYNIMAYVNKADNSGDSLQLGMISSGSGTLSVGTYDATASGRNTFISYSAAGLINISARDSIWIKGAVPAASADSILGVVFRSPGVSKIVKIPTPSGGGATLNNIGSGFRWVATPGGNIKTAFGDNSISIDSSSNANALTFKVDTSVIATQYDLTQITTSSDTALYSLFNGYTDAEQEVNKQPYIWEQISGAARFQWYDGVSIATVKDTLIMFGGWNSSVSNDSVFHSADGGATWAFRGLLPYAVHTPAYIPNASDGYTYIIGGDYLNNNTQRATVYRTRDFRTYETMTTSSPFNDRVLHGAVEFNGALYCGGGQFYTLNAADGLFTDIYRSTDRGVTWTLLSNSLTFMGKNINGCFRVFDGRMYVVSGGIYDNNPANKTFDRSVFASTNGVNWYQLPDSIPFQGMQYINTFVWNGKLWIAGGFGGVDVDNIDSTAFLDKSQKWHVYKPTQLPSVSHAAGNIVYKDMPLQILGNNTNTVWRLKRNTDIWYEHRPFYRTSIGVDSLRRNSNGYNIDAFSTTGENENRFTNAGGMAEMHVNGTSFEFYPNGIKRYVMNTAGNFYATSLLSSSSSTSFYIGTYYNTSLQTTENFPGVALSGASHRFVLGLDDNLVGFRLEDGGTNGLRFKHNISNGKTVIAENTTNNYDVATVLGAALAIKSTTSGFLPPVMTATQRNAITTGRIGALTVSSAGSGYTDGTYQPVPLVGGAGTSATAQIVISGGVVTSATALNVGSNYDQGDVLTFAAGDVGGTGSGGQLTASIQEAGLLVYDTDSSRFSGFNGEEWKMVAWTSDIIGGGGITTLNTLTAATQTFATGTSGTDFNISSSSSTHTFNIPSASASNRGLVTTASQTFAGAKTFTTGIVANNISQGAGVEISGNRSSSSAPGVAGIALSIPAFTYTSSAGAGTETQGQNFNVIGSPTLTSSNAVTYTGNVVTALFSGAPIAGGSSTIDHAYNIYANGANYFQTLVMGVNEQSGDITIGNSSHQIYTGAGGNTWTMPALSTHPGKVYFIKNIGGGNLTVQRAGSDQLYNTSAVNSITVAAGADVIIVGGSTYWVVED